MRVTPTRITQAVVVAGTTALLLLLIVMRQGSSTVPVARAGFELAPMRPGGPSGIVFLERRNGRLTGTYAVWGLQPGSRHAAALREGAPGRCGRGQVVRALPALVASADGVAAGRFDVPAPSAAFEPVIAFTVHAGEDRLTGPVACGAAQGAQRLAPAEVSARTGTRRLPLLG